MREEFQLDGKRDVATREMPAELRSAGQPGAAVPTLGGTVASEDGALSRLKNRDLATEGIQEIAQNSGLMKSRKVRMAVASHPHTPRRLALRVIRELFTFELMQFALMPIAAADLRRIADELLLARLPSITLGERISLARRSSELVAGGLLLDKEVAVWRAALENPRLTEAAVVKALRRTIAAPAFVEAVSHHAKWSVRSEIRMALLSNAHTPLARAMEFAQRLRPAQLRDILHSSRLPEKIKHCLKQSREARPSEQGSEAGK
jgi:hypothetical protein